MIRLLLVAMASLSVGASAADKPNIVFILADDLGWGDLACYGNEWFETPHLDQLAAEGVRFTNAYSPAPICSASRAAILTGKTPARLGFEFVTKDKPGGQTVDAPLKTPPFTLNLPLEEETIAERLGADGYRTAFFGKWHINQHFKRYLGWSPTHGPKAQGFAFAEEDFGAHPYSYWNRKKQRTFLDLPEGELPKDTMNERAAAFIRGEHEQPFFLMVSHFHVHTPVHTRAKWLHDRYFAKLPADHPRREKLAHYGAMVTTLDTLVGDLMRALDEAGLRDDTLVVFTSDNGGHPGYAGNAPLRGSKWNLYEGGIRVPMIARWPGEIAPGSVRDQAVAGTDLFATFADEAEHFDGRSLRPLLGDGNDKPQPRPLFWHFPYYHPERGYAEAPAEIGVNDGVTSQTRPVSAIRDGDWKLLRLYESGRDELYDLASDPGESNDLAKAEPEVTQRLGGKLDDYLEEVDARLPTRPAKRPNVILILVDDFGRELIGCLGGESYETPNIDRLAGDGMSFDICYATPMCSPTRNMLLSGKYNFRNYTAWGEYRFDTEPTIANTLQSAGYATAVAGKWHLGGWDKAPFGPERAGFERHCTFNYPEQLAEDERGVGNFFWNTHLWQDGERRRLGETYAPAAFRDYALEFIEEGAKSDAPFFLYYPMILAHRPFVPTDAGGETGVEHRGRRGEEANFAAMVSYVDATVGAIREALIKTGQAGNTLLLFTADNGTDCVQEAKELRSKWRGQSLRGGKYHPTELGANVPLFAVWRGVIEPGSRYSKPVDFTDIHPTLSLLGGVKPPAGLDGHDLTRVMLGVGETPRQYAYTWGVFERSSKKYKTPEKYRGELLHILRDERWKYQSDNTLYDLAKGWPQGEPVPRAEHKDVRQRMREALRVLRQSEPKLW